jgi:hypothetical protein
VDYKGDGQYQVLIYDNNWPDTTRAISFDTNEDTWSYDAASNPSDPSELYQGAPNLRPFSCSRRRPVRAPFRGRSAARCQPRGSTTGTTGATRTGAIYLTGSVSNHARVLVTDQKGRHLGYVNGSLVNQIPGRPLRAADLR